MVNQPGSSGTGRWNSRRRCGQTTRDSIARTITARVGSHSVQWDDERAREARLHAANGGINRALIMQDQHEGIQHEQSLGRTLRVSAVHVSGGSVTRSWRVLGYCCLQRMREYR